MADQSNEMIERVARALMLADGYEPECWPYQAARYLKLARAAIEAMREPPRAITMAVERRIAERARSAPDQDRSYGEDVWDAGIDAALRQDDVMTRFWRGETITLADLTRDDEADPTT